MMSTLKEEWLLKVNRTLSDIQDYNKPQTLKKKIPYAFVECINDMIEMVFNDLNKKYYYPEKNFLQKLPRNKNKRIINT